jgi:hypothetical protein
MPIESVTKPGQLAEKPWRTDAVARLGASIVMCFLIGGSVTMIFRYFGTPEKTSVPLFLGLSSGALGSFAVGLVLLGRPWLFETYLRKLIAVLACFYGGFFLMWLAGRLIAEKADLPDSIFSMVIAVLSFQGGALVLVHFFLREHHLGWAEGFGLNKNFWLAILLGTVAGIVAVPVMLKLQGLSAALLESLTIHPHEQAAVEILRTTEGWPSRLFAAIATIVIAPLGEEVLFRGILYPWIKRMGFPRLALWGTAVLFGTIHFNLAALVPLTLLAMVLIWLYEYTGNLLASITTHCLFNAANFVALYLFQNKM